MTQTGTMVAGSVQQRSIGGTAEIRDGAIQGNALSFKVDSPSGGRTITFVGAIEGDSIDFTRSVADPNGTVGGDGAFGTTGIMRFSVRRVPPTPLETDREFDKGSRVALDHLTAVQINNLATLGKVWGFLKYHHPSVVSGARQSDYELFRVMPAILAATDRQAADATLAKWVGGLGSPRRTRRESLGQHYRRSRWQHLTDSSPRWPGSGDHWYWRVLS